MNQEIDPPCRVRLRHGLVAGVVALLLNLTPVYAQDTMKDPQTGAPESNADREFRDWRLRCESKDAPAAGRCFLFQNIVMREGGQRLLTISVGYLPGAKGPAAIFTMPLGMALPPGVSVAVDDGEAIRFPVERCEPAGCIGGLPLDDGLVARFKAGLEARVTFHDRNRRPITVPVSLRGFTAGFREVR